MYTIAVKQEFVAYHFLIGGDWGAENKKHSHLYKVEVQMGGDRLNEYGYLADIADIKARLTRVVYYFTAKTLNDLPEFKDINPSLEHFARIIHSMLFHPRHFPEVSLISVKVWENEDAWTCYREEC
jgi:6-pyruvoyltetrahydropterin/6-carboxytetrahydropterin synthase